MPEAYQTRIVTGAAAQLHELAAGWRACLDNCPPEQQLFSLAWYESWLRTYGSRAPWTGRACVISVADASGSPCAFLPLVYRRSQGITYLSLAGLNQPFRSFPCVPHHAEQASAALATALFRGVPDWDVLRLGPTDDATPERAALLSALRARSRYSLSIARGRTVVNTLHQSFETYSESKSVKRIEKYARRFQRDAGSIRRFSNPDGETAAVMFREMGEIERRSWLAREGGSMRFVYAIDHEFWRQVTETSLSPGRQLDVWIAYHTAQPIGFRIALSSGEMSYLIANQYDESFAHHSLGWILYLEHLRAAVERGVRFIDSAPGDLHYKERLGGREAQMRLDVVVFRDSAFGWALSGLLGGLQRLRRSGWGRRVVNRFPGL